jgi:drug/metabolite transporter (DMT)-like permease
MARHPIAILALACMCCVMIAAQLLLKMAGLHASTKAELFSAIVFNPWMWAACVAFAVGLVCWMRALRELSLATAYPWTSLIYAVTPLLANLCFGEQLGGHFLSGLVLIVCGVFLTAGGVRTP